MSTPVKLQDVVDEMDSVSDEHSIYLNMRTGEFVMVTDEDIRIVEDSRDTEDLPDWQQDYLPKVKEALTSDDCVVLPSKFDIHEWSIMERFVESVADLEQQERLANAIHGRGAFRNFHGEIHQLEIQDHWYSFRQKAFGKIAIAWLEENEIPFEQPEEK